MSSIHPPVKGGKLYTDNWALIEHITDMAERLISTINQVKSDKLAILDAE